LVESYPFSFYQSVAVPPGASAPSPVSAIFESFAHVRASVWLTANQPKLPLFSAAPFGGRARFLAYLHRDILLLAPSFWFRARRRCSFLPTENTRAASRRFPASFYQYVQRDFEGQVRPPGKEAVRIPCKNPVRFGFPQIILHSVFHEGMEYPAPLNRDAPEESRTMLSMPLRQGKWLTRIHSPEIPNYGR